MSRKMGKSVVWTFADVILEITKKNVEIYSCVHVYSAHTHAHKQMTASEWNTYFLRNNDDNSLLFIVVVEALAGWLCVCVCSWHFAIELWQFVVYAKAISNSISTFIRRGSQQWSDEQMFAAPNEVQYRKSFDFYQVFLAIKRKAVRDFSKLKCGQFINWCLVLQIFNK